MALEVSALHDDYADVALNRRHGFKGKGAAVVASVLASSAHTPFGLVMASPSQLQSRR